MAEFITGCGHGGCRGSGSGGGDGDEGPPEGGGGEGVSVWRFALFFSRCLLSCGRRLRSRLLGGGACAGWTGGESV